VSAWGKSENENFRLGISKSGNRPGPVDLFLVGAAPGLPNAAAVVAKTGAELTRDDGFVNLIEKLKRSLCVGGCHRIP
jgi:hypothetical protein